jgi:PadR family transcriptional regulator
MGIFTSTMARTTIDLLQGTLGTLILKAVSREPLHGYAIARWIEEVTGDEVLIEDGSLYPALHRLQAMKLLSSDWGTSDSGRRVKRYAITEEGRAQLRAEAGRWARFSSAVTRALGTRT